jgi:hypothetical protein
MVTFHTFKGRGTYWHPPAAMVNLDTCKGRGTSNGYSRTHLQYSLTLSPFMCSTFDIQPQTTLTRIGLSEFYSGMSRDREL